MADAARGLVSGDAIEELMPTPQHHPATPDDDPSDSLDFAWIVPTSLSKANGGEPEYRLAVPGPNVNVRWFEGATVLIGEEVERVGSEAVDDWHAHLVGQVDGAPSMPRAPYLAVTS